MLILFGILVILASAILGLIVLIQNPKGGGLTSGFGNIGTQLMGVKQTTDVLEKGTWLFAAIVAVLCITSPMFIPKNAGNSNSGVIEQMNVPKASSNTPAPAQQTPAPAPANGTPATGK
ncbi:MAG: preprotein translocase subunit SecG [Ferruginibacter sp.]